MRTSETVGEVMVRVEGEARGERERAEREIAALRAMSSEAPGVTLAGGTWVSSDASRMADVALELTSGACEPRHDDPVEAIARPCFFVLDRVVHFTKEYVVATVIPGHLEQRVGWAEAMRADGLSAPVIRACGERLAATCLR